MAATRAVQQAAGLRVGQASPLVRPQARIWDTSIHAKPPSGTGQGFSGLSESAARWRHQGKANNSTAKGQRPRGARASAAPNRGFAGQKRCAGFSGDQTYLLTHLHQSCSAGPNTRPTRKETQPLGRLIYAKLRKRCFGLCICRQAMEWKTTFRRWPPSRRSNPPPCARP